MSKKKDSPELFEVLKAGTDQKQDEQHGAEQPGTQAAPTQEAPEPVKAVPQEQPEPKEPSAQAPQPLPPEFISMSVQSLIVAIVLICLALIVSFSLGITYGKHMAGESAYQPAAEEDSAEADAAQEPALPRQPEVITKIISLYSWQNDSRGQNLQNANYMYGRVKNSGIPGSLKIKKGEDQIFLVVEIQVKAMEDAVHIRDRYRAYTIDGKAYFKSCEIY